MPYIMVTGNLSSPSLFSEEETVVVGLPKEERESFLQEISNMHLGKASISQSKKVKVQGKGIAVIVLNKLHSFLGYDVISHSMAIVYDKHERMSWTMYKGSGKAEKTQIKK